MPCFVGVWEGVAVVFFGVLVFGEPARWSRLFCLGVVDGVGQWCVLPLWVGCVGWEAELGVVFE